MNKTESIKGFIKKSMVFNHAALARIIGVDRSKFSRWINDKVSLSISEEYRLELLLKDFGYNY